MALLANLKTLFIPHKANGKGQTPVPFRDYGDDMRVIETWSKKVITQLVAGANIGLDPPDGTGPTVTISASGGGGGGVYASLTGPGQSITPGELKQRGWFNIIASRAPTAQFPMFSVESTEDAIGVVISVNSTGTAALISSYQDTGPNATYPSANDLYVQTLGALVLSGGPTVSVGTSTSGQVLIDAGTNIRLRSTNGGTISLIGAGAGTTNIVIHNTSNALTKLGFFGATPIVQPTVTGSRGGNAALASLITQLVNLGLIIDSTTP